MIPLSTTGPPAHDGSVRTDEAASDRRPRRSGDRDRSSDDAFREVLERAAARDRRGNDARSSREPGIDRSSREPGIDRSPERPGPGDTRSGDAGARPDPVADLSTAVAEQDPAQESARSTDSTESEEMESRAASAAQVAGEVRPATDASAGAGAGGDATAPDAGTGARADPTAPDLPGSGRGAAASATDPAPGSDPAAPDLAARVGVGAAGTSVEVASTTMSSVHAGSSGAAMGGSAGHTGEAASPSAPSADAALPADGAHDAATATTTTSRSDQAPGTVAGASSGRLSGGAVDRTATVTDPMTAASLASADGAAPGGAPVGAAAISTPANAALATTPPTTSPSATPPGAGSGELPPGLRAFGLSELGDHLGATLRSSERLQTLSIQLHPAELGAIKVEARLVDGIIHLSVTPDSSSTADRLASTMSDLRHQLARAGVDLGGLGLFRNGPDRDSGHAHRDEARRDQADRDRAADGPTGLRDRDGIPMDPTSDPTSSPHHGGLVAIDL